jgi:invasion protein IalB
MSEYDRTAASDVQETPAMAPPQGRETRSLSHIARRALVPVLCLIAGGAIALIGERLIFRSGDANETRVLAFQDWRLVCPPESQANARCTLSQEIVRQEGGTLVMLALNNTAADSRLVVTVPHGVMLDPGVGFASGKDTMKVHPYETCTQAGCFAYVPLDAATLKSMQDNMAGQVVVVPANGQPVAIPFSLRGFKEGREQLAEELGRRGSVFGFLTR